MYLEYAGSVGRSPGVEYVIFTGTDEPLATVGELQRQHATLVQMQLILVRLTVVQHLHVATLHADYKQTQMGDNRNHQTTYWKSFQQRQLQQAVESYKQIS